MVFPGKIDLHMHTVISDGTDTPEEIVALVRGTGIELFSVTDHDAFKAARIIPPLLAEGGPGYLTGAEFSCRDKGGKYHILGYGFDPDSEAMRGLVELGHRYRMEKVQARIEFLKTEFGFEFPEEEIRELLSLDNPGKPHIGNMMVRHGYAEAKDQAIRQYIDKLRIPSKNVLPEEAIAGILGGGGIPVLAHPSYGDGDQIILGDDMEKRLLRLMDMGLQGLEAFYSGFTDRIRLEVLSLAERYGLYVTAGSDYHGRNKMVELGDTGLDDASEGPEGLKRFLEDVRKERI